MVGGGATLTTETFIKNAVTIEEYFRKESKGDQLSKAAIVPYFFIKEYNAYHPNQEEQRAIYKAYIDKFIAGRPSLDIRAANVICLYVYACYAAASKPQDFTQLRTEIDRFIKDYPQNLGENGDMSIQSGYLEKTKEDLPKGGKGKPFLSRFSSRFHKVKPYPSSNL